MLTLIAVAALAAAPTPDVKEGEWETTTNVIVPGLPTPIPPIVMSRCLTKKDLVPPTQQPGQECKLKNQKISAEGIEWAVECKDQAGNTSQGSGKIVYKGETMSGNVQMTTNRNGQPMQVSYRMTGKRTGPCKPVAAQP